MQKITLCCDMRVKQEFNIQNQKFWWFRPIWKIKCVGAPSFQATFDIEELGEHGIEFEFTENRDLIIHETLQTILEFATSVEFFYID